MVEKYESFYRTRTGYIDKATGFGPECHVAEGCASDDEVETVEINKMVL